MIRLYSERVNPEGIAIELAIRQWARTAALASEASGQRGHSRSARAGHSPEEGSSARADGTAERAAASVDAARLSIVTGLYRQLGLGAEDAQARAVLFYSFIFGQSLLVLGQGPRKRASITEACADLLTEVG
jgi:hypothetical protein